MLEAVKIAFPTYTSSACKLLYIKVGKLLNVLQSGVVYFAGADLDHLGHIVNKDLAITDMAGVQNLGGGVDDLVYRDLADNNFNLDLGNQGCVDLSTTVFLAAAPSAGRSP